LLDEPTSGLDPSEVQNFKRILTHTKQQTAIVLATHVLSDVAGLYDQHLHLSLYPSQLDFRLGATEESARSVSIIHEDANECCNNA